MLSSNYDEAQVIKSEVSRSAAMVKMAFALYSLSVLLLLAFDGAILFFF